MDDSKSKCCVVAVKTVFNELILLPYVGLKVYENELH